MRAATALGNPGRLGDIIGALESRDGPQRVLVIGGSETSGMGCEEPGGPRRKACAWPARFERWLRAEYPSLDISVDNQGVGGMTTTASLPLLKRWVAFEPAPSLVMVDYIVNDSVDPQEQGINSLVAAMELMLLQLHAVPVVFVATCAVESCHRVKTAISFGAQDYGSNEWETP